MESRVPVNRDIGVRRLLEALVMLPTNEMRDRVAGVENNDIIPGFDESLPRLDDSWKFPDQIAWTPLSVQLETVKTLPLLLRVHISGELEAFNGSYLSGKIFDAIGERFRYIWLSFETVTIGDYREVLFVPLQRKIVQVNGLLVLERIPATLIDHYQTHETLLSMPNPLKMPCVHLVDHAGQAEELVRQHMRSDHGMDALAVGFPRTSLCFRCERGFQCDSPGNVLCPSCGAALIVDRFARVFKG